MWVGWGHEVRRAGGGDRNDGGDVSGELKLSFHAPCPNYHVIAPVHTQPVYHYQGSMIGSCVLCSLWWVEHENASSSSS